MLEEKSDQSQYDNLVAALLETYSHLENKKAIKAAAKPLLDGLSEGDIGFIGTKLRQRMFDWDKVNAGKGPNPYAGVVYSLFPPAGGS